MQEYKYQLRLSGTWAEPKRNHLLYHHSSREILQLLTHWLQTSTRLEAFSPSQIFPSYWKDIDNEL